jgi:hypothetical protein
LAQFPAIIYNRLLAIEVAKHKSMLFAEKIAAGAKIDYFKAMSAALKLIATGASLTLRHGSD